MAKKYECDRCGKIFEPKDYGWTFKNKFGPLTTKIDLCPDCEDEFDKWLQSKKDNKEDNIGTTAMKPGYYTEQAWNCLTPLQKDQRIKYYKEDK